MPRKLVERKDSSASSKSAVASSALKIKKTSLKKKVAPKRESARKVVKMVTKAEKTERISITNGIKKVVVFKPTVSKPVTVIQDSVQGAILSSLLVRINNPRVASHVARYTGVMFVMIGAIFTIYNINAVNSYFNSVELPQVAQLAGTTDCVSGTVECAIDPTPDPDFNVESSAETLSGTIPVNITVPLATQIVLIAKSTDSNQTYTLGTLSKVSDLAWRTYWRTTEYLDGTYRLKVIITNQYGTYNFEDSHEYTLLNHPIETTQNSTTTTTTTDTSGSTDTTTSTTSLAETTTVTEPLLTVAMRIEVDSVLRGKESVRIFVEDASSVKLFIRPRGTTVSMFTTLGSAGFSGNSEWRFEWDTLKIPNGAYDLRAQAILQNGSSVMKTVSVGIDNATTTTTLNATTTTDTEEVPASTLELKIELNIAGQSPLVGGVEIYVDVLNAQYVELYSIQDKSLTPRFVGLAKKQSDSIWRYRLETINIPNGSYQLFAKVRHVYGDSVSDKIPFSIKNVITEDFTQEEVTYVESLKEVSLETQIITSEELLPPPQLFQSPTIALTENPTPTFLHTSDEDKSEIEQLLSEFSLRAQELMQEYGRAIRNNDTERKEEIRARMNELENEILTKLPESDARENIAGRIKEYLGSLNTELRERVERTETIIKERVGDAVTKDTDKDGLSDYDEVSIYKTDPFVADTDKDGYTDGAEISSGYNPLESAPQVNIQYESPKDMGLVREDLFTITTVSALSSPNEGEETIIRSAVIAGTGLPNSFVTLYIFSTPIIVTVKTDTEGNWSYIFDKELEDGEHEIYVGITDNAGKIVAKSNPFTFVKTAEAFSPVDAGSAAAFVTEPATPALIGEQMMLAIGSIAVVAIGLVLILLGLHAKPREEIPEPA